MVKLFPALLAHPQRFGKSLRVDPVRQQKIA
jgi:hypothetical protein